MHRLKQNKQWVCWKFANIGNKLTKIPIDPIWNTNAKSNRKSTWNTLEDCKACNFDNRYDGYGVMFDNCLCGIDIDAHFGHNKHASDILDMFRDTYIEYSPSGKGYHILFYCDIDKLPTRFVGDNLKLSMDYYQKNAKLDIECYFSGLTKRFFTVTGKKLKNSSAKLTDKTDTVLLFLDKYMKREKRINNTQYSPNKNIDIKSLNEDEFMKIISKSKNYDKFSALFIHGDIDTYNHGDHSNADLSLCCILAFYFNRDPVRIDELFRKSALFREKWNRDDYRELTISNACSMCSDTFGSKQKIYKKISVKDLMNLGG